MNPTPAVSAPVQRFMDDLAAFGAPAHVDGPRLLYKVLAVAGPLAGQWVTTGVSIAEVENWPHVPPHWVHLPDTVRFAQTNTDTSDCPSGWTRHSREFVFADTSVPPALAWLRHVRGLLSLAVDAAAA